MKRKIVLIFLTIIFCLGLAKYSYSQGQGIRAQDLNTRTNMENDYKIITIDPDASPSSQIVKNITYSNFLKAYFPDASETDQGLAGNGQTIKTYVDALGSKTGTIILKHTDPNNDTEYLMETNETIPANITLKIEPGAYIDGNATLTINGPFEAGLTKCFDPNFDVSFGDGTPDQIHVEWWGAIPNVTADCSYAVNSAINSISKILYVAEDPPAFVTNTAGGKIKFQSGFYYTQNPINCDRNGLIIEGMGRRSTIIKANHTGNVFSLVGLGGGERWVRHFTMSDLEIDGNNTANAGIYAKYCGWSPRFENIYVDRCTYGVYRDTTSLVMNFEDCFFHNNTYGVYTKPGISNPGTLSFINCDFMYNTEGAIYGQLVLLLHSVIEDNGSDPNDYAIFFKSWSSTGKVSIINNHIEDNYGTDIYLDSNSNYMIGVDITGNKIIGGNDKKYQIELDAEGVNIEGNYFNCAGDATHPSFVHNIRVLSEYSNYWNISNNEGAVDADFIDLSGFNSNSVYYIEDFQNDIVYSRGSSLLYGYKGISMDNIISTFTDGDTTPSVLKGNIFLVSNTGHVTITNLDDGVKGQEVTFIFKDSNTTIDNSSNIRLKHSIDWNPDSYDTLTLVSQSVGYWVEKSRNYFDSSTRNYDAWYATDTAGGTDAYVITIDLAITSYPTGLQIYFDANTANTGACSLNVNSIGAKSIKAFHDQDPPDNYIEDGSIVHVIYDGTNFQLMSPNANP